MKRRIFGEHIQEVKCLLGFHKWGEYRHSKYMNFIYRSCLVCGHVQRRKGW